MKWSWNYILPEIQHWAPSTLIGRFHASPQIFEGRSKIISPKKSRHPLWVFSKKKATDKSIISSVQEKTMHCQWAYQVVCNVAVCDISAKLQELNAPTLYTVQHTNFHWIFLIQEHLEWTRPRWSEGQVFHMTNLLWFFFREKFFFVFFPTTSENIMVVIFCVTPDFGWREQPHKKCWALGRSQRCSASHIQHKRQHTVVRVPSHSVLYQPP